MMTVFLKLGGSLITDKTREEAARPAIIGRLAREIRAARQLRPDLRILLGHGSGSFGHFAARQTGFLERTAFDPMAYAAVAAAAARLNRIVTDICVAEGVPAVSLSPSVSARCSHGRLHHMATSPIETLLFHGAVPLVHGDVALDDGRGATIVSTEEVFVFLAHILKPRRIILAGEVDGVYTTDPTQDPNAKLIREITPTTYPALIEALGGSTGIDVTGGMLTKVRSMVELVEALPEIEVYVISGLKAGNTQHALTSMHVTCGTIIHARAPNVQRSNSDYTK